MGQYPARSIGKELLFVLLLWQECGSDGHCGFVAGNLVSKAPIGTACIERIEDQVAPCWRVELRGKLQRRIVDDGSFSSLRNLAKNLPDRRRLTGAGVA